MDPLLKQRILERCRALAPELLDPSTGDFVVLSDGVGLRPSREGGPRVQLETSKTVPSVEDGNATTAVVYCYGHSGAG